MKEVLNWLHGGWNFFHYFSYVMTLNGKNYKLYYLDTCALSELVKDRAGFGSNLLNLILNDGIIAISPHTFWELKASPQVYMDVIQIVKFLPAVLISSEAMILEQEFNKLENSLSEIDPIVVCLSVDANEVQQVNWSLYIDHRLNSSDLNKFSESRSKAFSALRSKPSNIFERNSLYERKMFEKSVQLTAFQIAASFKYQYVSNYITYKNEEFPIDKFPSLISQAYLLHYKYLNEKRSGSESDVQDILMSALYPYVDVVVTEANQCSIIAQVQKRHKFWNNLRAISIKQVRTEKF